MPPGADRPGERTEDVCRSKTTESAPVRYVLAEHSSRPIKKTCEGSEESARLFHNTTAAIDWNSENDVTDLVCDLTKASPRGNTENHSAEVGDPSPYEIRPSHELPQARHIAVTSASEDEVAVRYRMEEDAQERHP